MADLIPNLGPLHPPTPQQQDAARRVITTHAGTDAARLLAMLGLTQEPR